ncbi:metallophosphoesterase [Sulfurimonas sp. MAG313]|nr:metallophosphoesterase [Sulfurimonas sp. MAG313]MDF1881266.1 metallophosphoesterase [Sulfurimonas sp. MAG313]
MSHKLILQEGAILIADAHYSDKYPHFFSFLKALDTGAIQTPQLILMGDMFELLFGVIKTTLLEHEEEVFLLNKLSEKIDIIYFEGNHDFKLKTVFPKIKTVPLEAQPQMFRFKTQDVLLSHGDTNTPLSYQIYTKLIRNSFILTVIGFMDSLCSQCILNWLKKRGMKKNPCYKMPLFKNIIKKRLISLKNSDADIVLEGHFHQDVSFNIYGFKYINLASFACNRKYFVVQSYKEQLILHETFFKEL